LYAFLWHIGGMEGVVMVNQAANVLPGGGALAGAVIALGDCHSWWDAGGGHGFRVSLVALVVCLPWADDGSEMTGGGGGGDNGPTLQAAHQQDASRPRTISVDLSILISQS
jgi:hypothetical protein